MTGYSGGERYVDERAAIDGNLTRPVRSHLSLRRLGLASERTLDAYERLFHDGDASAFPVLMQAGGPDA